MRSAQPATAVTTPPLKTPAQLRHEKLNPRSTPFPKTRKAQISKLWLQRLESRITAANSASMGLIFLMRQYFTQFFHRYARFVLGPFNATCNLARAVLAVYLAYEEGTISSKIRALVSVLSGVAIATSILGSLIMGVGFAFLGPALSIFGFSVRSLYHLSATLYFGTMGLLIEEDEVQAAKDQEKALANLIATVQSILNVIAITMVLVFMEASFGILGVVAGILGASYQLYSSETMDVPDEYPSTIYDLIYYLASFEASPDDRLSPKPNPKNTLNFDEDSDPDEPLSPEPNPQRKLNFDEDCDIELDGTSGEHHGPSSPPPAPKLPSRIRSNSFSYSETSSQNPLATLNLFGPRTQSAAPLSLTEQPLIVRLRTNSDGAIMPNSGSRHFQPVNFSDNPPTQVRKISTSSNP